MHGTITRRFWFRSAPPAACTTWNSASTQGWPGGPIIPSCSSGRLRQMSSSTKCAVANNEMGRHTSLDRLIVPIARLFPPARCSPNGRPETRLLASANKTLGFGRKMIYRQFRIQGLPGFRSGPPSFLRWVSAWPRRFVRRRAGHQQL